MKLVKRIQKSEVFADLNQEDFDVILHALETGSEEVVKEVTEILDQEKAINELFDKSIEELTEHAVGVIGRRVKSMEKRKKLAEEEEVDHAQEVGAAEHEMDQYESC